MEELNFKQHGKNFKMFMWFVEQVNNGKTVEIHGVKYVVMDRKRYEELMRRALNADVQIIDSN